MRQEAIGSTLPDLQRRTLGVMVGVFKFVLLTGILALVAMFAKVEVVTSMTRFLHQLAGYGMAAIFLVFVMTHLAYVITLRGGHAYDRSRGSGYSLIGLAVAIIASALVIRYSLTESAFSIAIHTLAVIIVPIFFQTHVVRASGSGGS